MAERFVKQHEEAAERFLTSAVLMLGLAGAGLLRGRLGSLGRAATAVASIGLLVAGIQVGYLGGDDD